MKGKYTAIALAGAIALSSAPLGQNDAYAGVGDGKTRHVLLISIDGVHALDYINCSKPSCMKSTVFPTTAKQKPGCRPFSA